MLTVNFAPRESAQRVACPSGMSSLLRLHLCATTSDGRTYFAKTSSWPHQWCREYRIRLGVEFLYDALASRNKVPMPLARVLDVDGDVCWGREVIPGRNRLADNEDAFSPARRQEVKESLRLPERRDAFLRCSFLDVFLLNGDRTVTNVLGQKLEGHIDLSFIDHEQTFGWRANVEKPEENGIKSPEAEYLHIVDRYASFGRKFGWAREVSKREDRRRIFHSLELDVSMLDRAREVVPEGWLSPVQFSEIRTGMEAWWTFLRARPYAELDAVIFDVEPAAPENSGDESAAHS